MGSSGELAQLIGVGIDLETAVELGLVSRAKVLDQWLLHAPDVSLDDALTTAEACVTACLGEWLVAHNPYLAAAAVERVPELTIGRGAFDLLQRELAHTGRLGTLPLLNARYQPYLAYYSLADADEIDRQLGALDEALALRGYMTRRDFPETRRAVPAKAWRDILLRHAEWRGLGFIDDEGRLVAWP